MRRLYVVLALLVSQSAFASVRASLPPVSRTQVARAIRASDPRIEAARQKYLERARAGQLAPSDKKIAEEAHLSALALDARAAYTASGDRRGKLVILEGLDLAGKSSLALRLEAAFKGLPVRIVHWGAPKPQKTALWQDDYLAELPKPGELVIWDRSYLGRLTYDRHYGMIDEATVEQRISEVNGLEAMAKHQVDITKFFHVTPGREMARRIGKREAIAPEKLAKSDHPAFRDRKVLGKLALHAVKGTGEAVKWHLIDMGDAYAGRVELLERLAKHWGKQ